MCKGIFKHLPDDRAVVVALSDENAWDEWKRSIKTRMPIQIIIDNNNDAADEGVLYCVIPCRR
jgi:hypothetical protein